MVSSMQDLNTNEEGDLSEVTKRVQGIGCSRKRKEDPKFVQGRGQYVDDVKLLWFSLIWYAVRTPTPELSQSTKKKPSHYPRVHPSPLETYGCVASFDLVKGNLTVYVTSQAPHVVRTVVSSLSGISESKALGWQLDSGNYHFALQKVMDAVDYPALLEEQKVKRENGELMGIGVCTFTEIVGAGPTRNCDILGISRDYHGNEFR